MGGNGFFAGTAALSALLFGCAPAHPEDPMRIVAAPGDDDAAAGPDDDSASDDDTAPVPDDDTATPPDDDATAAGDDDATPPPDDDATPPPPPAEVCYPGDAEDWTACVPVVAAGTISDPDGDYDYGHPSDSPDPAAYATPDRFIDLSSVDGGLALAPHFALDEFMQESKGRYALMSPAVVEHMETIRVGRGEPLYVTSGYRSPGYNAGLDGAASWSRHMYGDAVDFYMAGTSISELEDDCLALGADYTALYDDGHVHCDWRYLPLDSGFFDASFARVSGGGPPPSRAALARDDSQTPRVGAEVRLRVLHLGFDEGAPRIAWTVLDGRGAVVAEGEGGDVVFVPDATGTHRVTARVGGRAAAATAVVEVAGGRR